MARATGPPSAGIWIPHRALLVVLAPLFAAALPVARDVLVLFFGQRYAGGAAVLQLLLVATYVAVIQVAAVNALSSGSRRDVRVPGSRRWPGSWWDW